LSNQLWFKYAIVTVPVLIFGVLGTAIATVAGLLALRRRRLLASATRVPATIVSYREYEDSEGFKSYFPRVRGQRPSGEAFEFESIGSSREPAPLPGTEVEVIIDPRNPERLWLRGHEWRSLVPWLAMGGFLAVGGFGLAALAIILTRLFG
jgi:hypothetical protein